MTTASEEIPDLAPAGGTPFAKLFSCCMPKAESSTSTKSISFADESKEIPATRELEMEMEEDEKTISEDDDEMEAIPDMDKEHSAKSPNPSPAEADWLMEFWKMILSMFFLQWLQEAKNRKRLKDSPESEAPPTIAA